MIVLLGFLWGLKAHGQTLRVMAYNIHHGCNSQEKLKLNEVAELISHNKFDIVGLVEVDSVCQRSDNIDQPARLAKMTGMHTAFVRHFAFDGGAYGLALLSRFPISGIRNIRIPVMTDENGDTTRALLVARVTVPGMGKIEIVVAHLDYRSEISRERQADFLLDFFKNDPGRIMILGDLNAAPNSKSIEKLKSRFRDANRSGDKTYPADAPREKIDYILLDKNHQVETSGDAVYPVQFSDHRPISIELAFR